MNTFKKIITVTIISLLLSTPSFASQNSAYLFVSLGMPDDVLTQYLIQAKQYHIPVVIRGLYTAKDDTRTDKTVGSFNDTANRVFLLLKKEKMNSTINKSMGGVSINPLLFRSFKITVVPALVVTNDASCMQTHHQKFQDTDCSADEFDVVYGNIPIQKQLKIIEEKSKSIQRSNLARNLLNQFESKVFTNE
jgi:type-F conjugative transfer system pilin assembly protein TrbC